MLPRSKWPQFGEDGLIVKGIIIHNTGNTLTAKENYINFLTTTNNKAYHFLVDSEEIIQVLPKTWKVITTEKEKDWSFENCLSISICNMTSSTDWEMSENRAIELINEWMKEFNLVKSDIYFHNDFNDKAYCPNKLLEIYKTKDNWLERKF